MKLLFKRSTRTRIRFYTVRSLSRCYAYVSGECIMKQYAKYGEVKNKKKEYIQVFPEEDRVTVMQSYKARSFA